MMARRCLSWLRKNRPSGILSGWMIFFVISYIVIIKLDSSTKTPRSKHPTRHENVRKRIHELPQFKPGVVRNNPDGIPKEVIADFERDRPAVGRFSRPAHGHAQTHDRLLNGPESEVDDDDELAVDLGGLNDNEVMLFHEMEGKQDEIEENWKNYLDKDKNVINAKIIANQHMRSQGVRSKAEEGESQLKVILPKLPKNVHVFDALSEGKESREAVANNKCVVLKTLHGDAPICIHNPEDDEIISSHLFEHGVWEPNFLYMTGSILKLEPELIFLDLGCNIGVYTILAAKLGSPVVALDPNKQNLRLLTKSLSLGNTRDKVTLLHNAISDQHENVSLVEIVGNIGGTFIEPSDGGGSAENTLETIMLDDLTELFKHKAVFIKMDIETYEWRALRGATSFFEAVDVRYILMEWIAHRGSDTAKLIIQFLTSHELYPHVNNHHNTKLEEENSHSWPDNVMWIKY